MNNAQLLNQEEETVDVPYYRERAQQLTEIIESLQKIASSSHWVVLKQYVFDVDLEKAKRSLAKTNDTTEMFRLQGEIRWGEKFNLEKLLQKYRDELTTIKKQL